MLDLYRQLILEEAKHPKNLGKLAHADAQASKTNSLCGDQVTVYLKVDNNQVSKIKWNGAGCIISQAHMSVLSEKVKGMTVTQIMDLTKQDLLQLLNLQEISSGRERCLLISLQAIKQAIKQLPSANKS